MKLQDKTGILKDETLATYISVGIVLLLFLMMEITFHIIFESTVVVLSHIFYFPVIVVSFLYPKRGVLLSTFISALYLIFIYIVIFPDFYGIVSATMQFYVYISVAVIVSIISEKLKSDRARLRSIFDYSESGVCVIDSDTGDILRANRKFGKILEDWGLPKSLDNIVLICGSDDLCREFLARLNFEGPLENYEMKINPDEKNGYYALISASKIPDGSIVMTLTDMTESRINAEEVNRLNKSLEDANEEANLYIDILAHDINNANTAARGYAELLYDNVSDEDRPYFDNMMLGIKQSSHIIDKVIRIRDVNSRRSPPVPYLLDEAVKCASEKLEADIRYVPSGHSVMAGEYLCDLFFYLFENSVAYGGEDVSIDVASEEKDGYVEVTVSDNGPGIPDSKKENLFMRFKPEGNSRKGRGLGLALCWLIADSYEGDIYAADVNPGNYKDGLKIVLKLKSA